MEYNNPFFSIVLPIFNVEKYLNRCVNSILNQDFEDYEVILIDDGSTDSCPRICDELVHNDKRFQVIHKKNAGLGMARNTGLEHAKGKYIFFLDSDDYILPGLLSDTYIKIQEEKADIVFYGFSRINKNGEVRETFVPNPEKNFYNDHNEIMNKLLADFIARDPYTGRLSNIRISAWNCCIKVDVLNKNSLKFVSEREYISEDIFFYISLFRYLSTVSFLNKAYYCYCQNEGSLTYNYREDRFLQLKKFFLHVTQIANDYGYSEEVQLRLKESFIASVMGCLKMEAGNSKNIGNIKAYKRILSISNDKYFIDAINVYPDKTFGKTWKMFKRCVINNNTIFLYIFLLVQYRLRGV